MAITRYMAPKNNGARYMQPNLSERVQINSAQPLGTGKGNASAQNQISWTLANGTGATVLYVIGDALGQVAQVDGRTLVNPTATSAGFTVAQQKANFATRPIIFSELNLQTSSTSAQFNQGFQLIKTDQNGNYQRYNYVIGGFASPSDYNALIRPVNVNQYNNPLECADYAGIVFPVLAGETLIVFANIAEQIVR